MAELIGSAELELGVDLAPLDVGLVKAERKVATSVAVMQAMLDKLSVHARDRVGLLAGALDDRLTQPVVTFGNAVARISTDVEGSWAQLTAGQEAIASSIERTATVAVAAAEVEEAAANKVTAAYLEQAAAAKLAGDASEASLARAAAVGVAPGLAGERGGGAAGLDAAALAALGLEGVRGKGHAGGRSNPLVVVLEAGRYTSLGALAAGVAEQGLTGPSGSSPQGVGGVYAAAPGVAQRPGPTVAGGSATDQRNREVQDAALLAATQKLTEAIGKPTVPAQAAAAAVTPHESDVATAAAVDAAAIEAAKRRMPGQFAPRDTASLAALEALGMTAGRSPSGSSRVYGIGGVPGTGKYGASPLATAEALQSASGGGGSRIPPWLPLLLFGHGGGGGGYKGAGTGLIGHALFGAAGLGAGVGSIGSFAGFGAEHIVLTLGGIAGSGVAALGGGALLGAGALGKLTAGAGSDLAVGASAAADTKTLYTAYEKLREAVAQYGAKSKQAKEAQAELNQVMKYTLSGTAGATAELHLAEKVSGLNVQWDKQTSGARIQFALLGEQAVKLGSVYIPLIAHAAEQNFAATNKAIRPLFAWLEGPEGTGIFSNLEQQFRSEIPTAIAALDQGVQLFGKTIAYTAPLTGSFLRALDRFFTKWNSPGEFSVWEGMMNRLIEDFHVWGAFIKILGADLVDLFNKDAHTGETIIRTLTEMLDKVHAYENSTKGAAAIRNIFLVHREEAIALLDALTPLVAAFSHIYTTVSPPLVRAATLIAEAFTKVIEAVDNAGGFGRWVVGLTLIGAKLKLLVPLLKAAGVETGLLTAAEDRNAAAAGLDAGAQGTLAATSTGTLAGAGGATLGAEEGEGGLLSGLALSGGTKGLLLKGGVAGAVGLLGGSVLSGAVGAKGTLASALQLAGVGAGVGSIVPGIGTAVGAVSGAAIGGATPYIVKGIEDLFSSGKPAFQREAERTARAYSSLSTAILGGPGPHQAAITHALIAAHEAANPTPHAVATGRGSGGIAGAGAPNLGAAAADYKRAGQEAAKEFIEGYNHVGVDAKSQLLFISALISHLDKLPGEARFAAAKMWIAYAQELEAKGELPKNAVSYVIRNLEQQFPHLQAYLEAHGGAVSSAFSKAFELKQVTAKYENAMTHVEQVTDVTFSHTREGVEGMLDKLREVIARNKGPYGEIARALFNELYFAANASWVLTDKITREGIARVNRELKVEIGQLGGKEIQAGFSGKEGEEGVNLREAPTGGGETGPPLKGGLGLAVGGLIQIGRAGQAGHDTVGLNVGGLPIAVAPGEQVAVFNRHQLPIVNAALAGYGGLPGLFDAVSTPHYMAGGGLIPEVGRASLRDVKAAAARLLGRDRARAGAGGGGSASLGHLVPGIMGIEERAAAIAGLPFNAAIVAALLQHESSGGVNEPPSGPLSATGPNQVIPPTFAEYALPGHTNINNPLDNAIASMRYIKATYGSLAAMAAKTGLIGGHYVGYARGGLIGFAGGGLVPPGVASEHQQRLTGGLPRRGRHTPKGAKPSHLQKLLAPLKGNWPGQGNWEQLNGLMSEGGEVEALIENYALLRSADEIELGKLPHNGEFIITPDGLEKQAGITSPYEEFGNVSYQAVQLKAMEKAENDVLLQLAAAWNLTVKVLAATRNSIAERRAEIAVLQAKIRANLKRIKELQTQMKKQRERIDAIRRGKRSHAGTAEEGKLRADIAKEGGTIAALEKQNTGWGGEGDGVGQGGNIGKLSTEVTELGRAQESATGWKHDIGGVQGQGGKILEATSTVAELEKQVRELGAVPEKLKEALLEGAGGAAGESAAELAERKTQQAEEKLKVKTEENKANVALLDTLGSPGDIGAGGRNAYAAAAARGGLFGALGPLPFAGSFDVGGIVPGPVGSPHVAIVHGGEKVTPPTETEAGPTFTINTLHPGDPNTLLAIARASNRGQGYQGLRRSKRIRVAT